MGQKLYYFFFAHVFFFIDKEKIINKKMNPLSMSSYETQDDENSEQVDNLLSFFDKHLGKGNNEDIHIVISGLIGVGKTTFIENFENSNLYDCQVFREAIDQNPYLNEFYENPSSAIAFKTQMYFLSQRLRNYNTAIANTTTTTTTVEHGRRLFAFDRHLMEDWVFMKAVFKQGQINQTDYNTYKCLFDEIIKGIKKPDLILFLKATPETCLQRIHQRFIEINQKSARNLKVSHQQERKFEFNIELSYLLLLEECYDEFIMEYKDSIPIFYLNWEKFYDFSFVSEQIKQKITNSKK